MLAFCYVGAETNIAAFLPSISTESHGSTIGVLAVSGFWAAVALGRWAWSVYGTRWFRAGSVVVMTGVMVLSLLAMSLTLGSSVVLLVVLAALCGLAAAGVSPVAVTLAVQASPLSGATVTSYFIGAGCLGGALLALPLGWVLGHYGARSGVVTLCLYSAVAFALALVAMKVLAGREQVLFKNVETAVEK